MKYERNIIRLLNGVVTRSALLSILMALSSISVEASPFAYVPNRDSGNVSVIDTASNTVVATISITPNGLNYVAITPDGKRAYVTTGSPNIPVIDTDPTSLTYNTVVATVSTPNIPLAVAITQTAPKPM